MADINSKTVASIAVIGSGYWSENLVRNFYQLGVLKLICDKTENILTSSKKNTLRNIHFEPFRRSYTKVSV
jgi:hypothetical protein